MALRKFVAVSSFCLCFMALRSLGETDDSPQSSPSPASTPAATLSDLALLKAAKDGDLASVKKCLLRGAAVDAENSDGWTPLIFAAKSGNWEMVHCLISHGADVNHRSSTELGSTVLLFGVGSGNLKVVKELLDCGAPVNGQGRNGMTPLIYTAAHGEAEVAKYLLSRGADVNRFGLLDSKGASWSPIMTAGSYNQPEMLSLLLKYGALLELRNNQGDTGLMELAKRPCPDSVSFFIDHGANVNARGPRGHTALIYAAFNGEIENVKLLLAAGADPLATATDAEDPEDSYGADELAIQQGYPEIAEIIRKAQAKARMPAPKQSKTEN